MTAMESLKDPTPRFDQASDFILSATYASLPGAVTDFAKLLILDLIGVAIGAKDMDASRIARDHAARFWCAGAGEASVPLMFDGRPSSAPGAAYAAATQIDNLDAHDGWQPSKGHAGAALLPALYGLSAYSKRPVSSQQAIAAMVVGYEIGYRAAAALHATVPDYHTSGAWNAPASAAIGARVLGLDKEALRHALGIAEYHGPRSQMMREIANPTMLHDGSGMGAPIGVMAALLARDGFTGAPAATLEFADAASFWDDLGVRWLTTEQYIKPYPVCRWAHAPIDGALALKQAHGFGAADIASVHIKSFEAAAALPMGVPATSPMAQYSMAWPVAAALAWGRADADCVDPAFFADPDLVRICGLSTSEATPYYEGQFPKDRRGEVTVTLTDGRVLESGETLASGGPVPLPTEAWTVKKFRGFAEPKLGPERTNQLVEAALALDKPTADFLTFLDLLHPPATS